MTFFTVVNDNQLKDTLEHGGCGACQSSCQSACKTSCTVGNQGCDTYINDNDLTSKQENVLISGLL